MLIQHFFILLNIFEGWTQYLFLINILWMLIQHFLFYSNILDVEANIFGFNQYFIMLSFKSIFCKYCCNLFLFCSTLFEMLNPKLVFWINIFANIDLIFFILLNIVPMFNPTCLFESIVMQLLVQHFLCYSTFSIYCELNHQHFCLSSTFHKCWSNIYVIFCKYWSNIGYFTQHLQMFFQRLQLLFIFHKYFQMLTQHLLFVD